MLFWPRQSCVSKFAARSYSTGGLPPLPPLREWRALFPATKQLQHRVCLGNPATATRIADAFVPSGSRDKIVLEAFPGPGQLTRALLQLPRRRIKKLVVLEQGEEYLRYLKPLESVDPRIQVVDLRADLWDTYRELERLGVLQDAETLGWDQGLHPHVHYVGHLANNPSGEQFLSQLLRSIPDRQWLFKYGRVPMSFLLSETLYGRVTGEEARMRCKLSMIASATASAKLAIPLEGTKPYQEHFHPLPSENALTMRGKAQKKGKLRPEVKGTLYNHYVAVNFMPGEKPAIAPGLLKKWDYCLRHLYVHRATPLSTALQFLAPNGQALLKYINPPGMPAGEQLDARTPIRQLKVEDWARVIAAFDEWPFAPEDLSVTDAVMFREEKHG